MLSDERISDILHHKNLTPITNNEIVDGLEELLAKRQDQAELLAAVESLAENGWPGRLSERRALRENLVALIERIKKGGSDTEVELDG